jgi:hypothetical protein
VNGEISFIFGVRDCLAGEVKPRAVQYWVEAGILYPDVATAGGGRGVRRMFYPSEVKVAGVAAALGPFGMSTPVLKIICDYARPVVAPESVGVVAFWASDGPGRRLRRER